MVKPHTVKGLAHTIVFRRNGQTVFGLVPYMFPNLIHLTFRAVVGSKPERERVRSSLNSPLYMLLRALHLCIDSDICLARKHKEADVNQKPPVYSRSSCTVDHGGDEEKWPLKLGHFRKRSALSMERPIIVSFS